MSKLRASKRKKQKKLKRQRAIRRKIKQNKFVGDFSGCLTMYMGGEESELKEKTQCTS